MAIANFCPGPVSSDRTRTIAAVRFDMISVVLAYFVQVVEGLRARYRA